MSSTFGKNIKISVFGQSHSEAIGVVIDGLPAGFKIDLDKVRLFMKRRAPGNDAVSTPRKEADEPEILSGLVDFTTCGAPLCAIIKNTNIRSKDYDKLKDVPRPAHSDFTAFVKYGGFNDVRGGGHFSGRLTAPLCFAGAICIQFLQSKGIDLACHINSLAGIKDDSFDGAALTNADLQNLLSQDKPVLNQPIWQKMQQKVVELKEKGDSAGGIIECGVVGLPVGLGNPMFDGVENIISSAIFAIPAVKGLEFGAGFAVSEMTGSENNDSFYFDGAKIRTKTNNHGGILGGITSGMPLIFRVAFKPTPSISLEQNSVSLSKKENCRLVVEGRHDPCIVLRAVPCVEAVTAIALFDLLIDGGKL